MKNNGKFSVLHAKTGFSEVARNGLGLARQGKGVLGRNPALVYPVAVRCLMPKLPRLTATHIPQMYSLRLLPH
jgi:hypothetical protein